MTQLAMDSSVVPAAPRRHRGPLPVFGPRRAFTMRASVDAVETLERIARERGMSLSAYCAEILEREAATVT